MNKCRQGQAAIILILLTAVALILFAVTLNQGRVSQFKTLTTIASNQAAATTASSFASYGEKVMQTQLGGKAVKSGQNGVLALFITIVAFAALMFIPGLGAAVFGFLGSLFQVANVATFVTAMKTAVVVATVFSVAAMTIQLAVIQPGLTSLWNRMQANLPAQDQYLQAGNSTGLQNAVSDTAEIPDYFDFNTNGKWAKQGQAAPDDTISRFGFFYTERMRGAETVSVPEAERFWWATKELVSGCANATPDFCSKYPADLCCTSKYPADFMLTDPMQCNGSGILPQCNPCCVPYDMANPDYDSKEEGSEKRIRIRPSDCSSAEVPPECQGGPYGSTYPFVYDPDFQDYNNNTDASKISFREKLGFDDENRFFKKSDIGMDDDPVSPVVPQENSGNGFNGPDATGYFQAEKQRGVYPFFWRLKDLVRVNDGKGPANTPINSKLLDNVKASAALQPVIADDGSCAMESSKLWKAGAEKFCNTQWPYDGCSKYKNGDAKPCEGDAGQWPEDKLDAFVYELEEFSLWARKMAEANHEGLENSFAEWYPYAAYWIAEQCPSFCGTGEDGNNPPDDKVSECVACNQGQRGRLLTLRDEMKEWAALPIEPWINTNFSNEEAWCGGSWDETTQCLKKFEESKDAFEGCRSDVENVECKKEACGGSYNPCNGESSTKSEETQKEIDNLKASYRNDYRDDYGEYRDSLSAEDAANMTPEEIEAYNREVDEYNRGVDEGNEAIDRHNAEIEAHNKEIDEQVAVLEACLGELSALVCPGKPTTCENLPTSLAGDQPEFDLCKSDDYKNWAVSSDDMAKEYAAQFKERRIFLESLKAKAEQTKDTFNQSVQALDAYLGTPTSELIEARKRYLKDTGAQPLSNFIVYGWRDHNPPKGSDRTTGYWHIVRSENFVPGRCPGNLCGPAKLPWVKTKSTGFLKMKREFRLVDHDGVTLNRVTRWDENHDLTAFANKRPLWQVVFNRPGAETKVMKPLDQVCSFDAPIGIGGTTLFDLSKVDSNKAARNLLKEAFMLNGPPNDKEKECFDVVKELLKRGVSTTTCAKYYLDPKTEDMALKFTPCPDGTIDAFDGLMK
jgi:hypothetical protein